MTAAERPLVRQVRPILARLVGDGADDDGPRMDWERAMVRYLSHRPFAAVRREDAGRPAVAVLPDVSGSCSAFCGESLRVAAAIGELGLPGADVYVVAHSNGAVCEATLNGRRVPAQAVLDNLRVHPEVAVVAIGDWDAEWLYRTLAERPEVTRLLWLDGYRCRVLGAPQADQPRFSRGAGAWSAAARRKVRYVIGCSSAAQFCAALRCALDP